MFYGYYLSAATMVADEHDPAVPELTRRITLASAEVHDEAGRLLATASSNCLIMGA